MKVAVCGDIHGRFDALDKVAIETNSDVIIQCGDFGFWPGNLNKIKTKTKIPIYFCRGNHEDHDTLDTYPELTISNLKTSERITNEFLLEKRKLSIKKVEVNKKKIPRRADNIFLCNHGSILTLEDTNILFFGGAKSIDKMYRKEGSSWWPQEIPPGYIVDKTLELIQNIDIDIVISHTAPKFIVEKFIDTEHLTSLDPTTYILEEIFISAHPKLWFFGHFHKNFQINSHDCLFFGLNACNYNTGKFNNDFYQTFEVSKNNDESETTTTT